MSIVLHNISRSYRSAEVELSVLDNLNYTFPETGSIAILGRSGVGKSTLLQMLAGLERPTSGEILIFGDNMSEMNDEELSRFRGKNIGFIFQFHNLLPEFNAVENVAMPLLIQGVASDKAYADATAILVKVGLEERLKHRPSELSGGEQQRVAIARALVSRPGIILADEPTGNLDYDTAAAVQRLLLDLNSERESLLLVVTHNRELAQAMDIVVEMKPGGALECCSVPN